MDPRPRSIPTFRALQARAALAALAIGLASPISLGAELPLVPTWGHPQPHGNPVYDYEFIADDFGFAVGRAGSVLATADAGETWELRADLRSFGKDLYGVATIDGVNLLAIGEAPGIFRSTDGGFSWTEVPNPSSGTLVHLFQTPDGRLDAAGANGEVLRSTDGGVSWSEIGPGLGSIESQWWTSEADGWVVGNDVAHRTTDGGATWSRFLTDASFGYHEVQFFDPLLGRVLEDFAVWTTTDGGSSWNREDQFVAPLYPRKTLPIGPGHWLLITNIEGAELWETFDSGASWEQLFSYPSVGFLDVARAPGGRIFFASDVGDLFWSDDLGHTQTNATHRLDTDLGPIDQFGATPGGTIYASAHPSAGGAVESWLRSTDSGLTWTAPTRPSVGWTHSICWPTEEIGLVAAYEKLYRTTDASSSWTLVTTLSGRRFTDLSLGLTDIFAGVYQTSNGDGTVLASDDVGLTWTDIGTPIPGVFAAWSVTFFDDQTGYAAGVQQGGSPVPRLYRTTNRGVNWTLVPLPAVNGFIRDMHWTDPDHGFLAMGTAGLYRTTNAGDTWAQATALPAWRIALRGTFGLTAGNWSDPPLASTDGGGSWSVADLPMAAYVSAVHATDAGFIVGGHGTALLRLAVEDVSGVGDADGSGDGAGDGSDPDDGGTVDPPTGSDGLVDGAVTLSVSGPHPGVGPTELTLRLDFPGVAVVTVHDVVGREVARLSDGFRSAGSFPLRWTGTTSDGSHAPAGVYYVRAVTDRGSDRLRIVRMD